MKQVYNKISDWMWDHIGWKVRDIYRSIHNLIRWLPIIWKDRDWDSHYIYEILKFKLQNQAKYIGEQDRHTGSKRDAEIMRTCARLIQKVQDEYYSMEWMDYTNDVYHFVPRGKDNYEMVSANVSQTYNDYYKRYPIQYKKVISKSEGPLVDDIHNNRVDDSTKQVIAMNIGHINHIRAKKLLFTILERHIDGWWD